MTKAGAADDLRQRPVTCPHCWIEFSPFLCADDWAVIFCGYCGKAVQVAVRDGVVKAEKV
jgi:transcription elongation factor Elf1